MITITLSSSGLPNLTNTTRMMTCAMYQATRETRPRTAAEIVSCGSVTSSLAAAVYRQKLKRLMIVATQNDAI